MTSSTQSATETPVEAAQRQRAEAQQAADDARRIRAEVERQLAESQARLAAAEQQAREAEQRIQEAENAARLAERDAMTGQHITHDRAELLARSLLEVLATARTEGRSVADRKRFWEQVDRFTVQFFTAKVDEDAWGLVLSVENLLSACARWEMSRIAQSKGGYNPDGARGSLPVDDFRVERHEQDLKRELEGQPLKPIETIGRLLSEGVGPAQIAKMYGIVGPDGEGELQQLGRVVDAAFERAGVDQLQPPAVRRYGCLDLAAAWERRRRRIETGECDELMPLPDALPGQGRPGRGYGGTGDLPDAPADAEDDDAPPQRQPIRMPRLEG